MTTCSRWRVAFATTLAGSLALAGCGSDSDSSSGSGSDGSTQGEVPTITIVTYDSFVLDEDVEAQIEVELGIDLVVSASGDGAEALSAAILTAGRPEGDIFFGVDNILLGRALADPVFAELDTELLTNLADMPEAPAIDDSGRLVPINVGPVCVNYDKAWFAENNLEPPADIAALSDPTYAPLLVVQSPVTSTPGLVFLAATNVSLDDADAFWTQLLGNGALVVGGWSEAWYEQYSVSGGDRPLVLSYASSPPVEVVYAEEPIDEPFSGVIEATCADQVEYAGVLDGSPNVELATKVVNAMIGLEYQQSLPLANFVYPVRPDAELPEVFATFAPRPTSSIVLDPVVVDEQRDAWIDRWREIAG